MSQNSPPDANCAQQKPLLLTDEDIRAQLDRICSSAEFDVPERARKFLTYVVEETIAGRADRIKAYSVATEVFGREDSFNPQTDPAVRLEAGRVRRALERYYLVAGTNDPVVITVPKGAYVPVFEPQALEPVVLDAAATPPDEPIQPDLSHFRSRMPQYLIGASCLIVAAVAGGFMLRSSDTVESPVPAVSDAKQWISDIPQLMVKPFSNISQSSDLSYIADGLTDEIIGKIARFEGITVVTGTENGDRDNSSGNGATVPPHMLEGSVRIENDKIRLSARLVNRADRSVAWAQIYDENLQTRSVLEIEADVADKVAAALSRFYGIDFRQDPKKIHQVPPDNWQAYSCTLAYQSYRINRSQQTHASVQDCLKGAVEQYPDYANAWALLALTHVDEMRYRYRFKGSNASPLDAAEKAARRALEIEPENGSALKAEMLVSYFRGDIKAALDIGAYALSINANDPELTGEYGSRLAFSGQWKVGCKLVEETVSRNPKPFGHYESSLAACFYMLRDYENAEKWLRIADLQENTIYHFVAAAIFGQLGKAADAAREKQWLEAHAPEFLKDARAEMMSRFARPEDQAHFLEGMQKAGLIERD